MKSQATSRIPGKTLVLSLIFSIWITALPVLAADLVNINTADSAALQTLNGIGPSKAQAIIDYRTQHGPFATIEDIQNVSGIGPATYNNIKDYITVSNTTAQSSTQTQTQSTTTNTTPQPVQSTGGSLPPVITATIVGNVRATAGAGSVFDGEAYDVGGYPLTVGVRYIWNFGDGEITEGQHAIHTYRYPGTYELMLTIAYNYMTASTREHIAVFSPAVLLVAEGDGSLAVYNSASDDLDIGLWSLVDGAGAPFVIPKDTIVLAGQGVRFAAAVTHLPGSPYAQLLYPNGTNAASAIVAANSPLRGEKVSAADVSVSVYADLPAGKSTTDTPNVSQMAAVSQAADVAGGTLGYSLMGLAALLLFGAAGAWYISARQPALAPATLEESEEFDVE